MTSLYDDLWARRYFTETAIEEVDKEGGSVVKNRVRQRLDSDDELPTAGLAGCGCFGAWVLAIGAGVAQALFGEESEDVVDSLLFFGAMAITYGVFYISINWLVKLHRSKVRERLSAERARRIERIVRDGVAAYQSGDEAAVSAVHDFTLRLLRRRVEEHRTQTLGPSSEWERKRAPLATALDEAEGRVAYWNERSREEPDSEMASFQLQKARKLEVKLRSALGKVDGRAEVLRQFYHRCEAKLAVLDRSNTDRAEIKRLEDLSGRADAVIGDAQDFLVEAAQHFLVEAHNIVSALETADESQLSMLAVPAPVDDIELVADNIHESWKRSRNTIQQLEKALDE